jgi:hypothetical protein
MLGVRNREVLLVLAGVSLAVCAFAQAPPNNSPRADIETITVQAAREHAILVRQVNQFVSAIAVQRSDQSLANWQRETPVCPLVAGLPRADGEYVLARLSEIASSAGAPLAPGKCKPNLFVVVTSSPDALLKAWTRRDPDLFDNGDDHGFAETRKFLDSKLPIRAWYNVEIYNDDGTPLNYLDSMPGLGLPGARRNVRSRASRVKFNDVRDLFSVIVLVDASRARGISYKQLSAYIGMIGLSEIKLDAKVDAAPSILQLFGTNTNLAPTGLTEWDLAFLKGLYRTDHFDQHQSSSIKTTMAAEIAAKR